jgi:hypothetical protein
MLCGSEKAITARWQNPLRFPDLRRGTRGADVLRPRPARAWVVQLGAPLHSRGPFCWGSSPDARRQPPRQILHGRNVWNTHTTSRLFKLLLVKSGVDCHGAGSAGCRRLAYTQSRHVFGTPLQKRQKKQKKRMPAP